MPTYPHATTIGANRSPLSYASGYPWRIVHHSTEGSSLTGAVAAYRSHRGWPHFTVDDTTVAQHIDTSTASFALQNAPGGVETNRACAIQIEVVGFAARPKNLRTLGNVARLCRWLEQVHGIPAVWPNGYPKTAVNGRDPGGHNRDAGTWRKSGGHYAHSTTPENRHWDPGYTLAEVGLVMAGSQPPEPGPQPQSWKWEDHVPKPLDFTSAAACPTGGYWKQTAEGGIHAEDGAPYINAYNAHPQLGGNVRYFVALVPTPNGGYVQIAHDGATYRWDP